MEDSRPLIVVHPGATAPSRRYPPEKFAEAIRRIHQAADVRFIITGSADEGALADEIQTLAGVPVQCLAGRLNLEELAALLSYAAVLLVNNTGPAHVAAAMGTPIVQLYALTNPQHTPWQVPCRLLYEDVPCRFCYKSVCPEGHNGCLRLVSPQRVAEAVLDMLTHNMQTYEDLSNLMVPVNEQRLTHDPKIPSLHSS
jgi:ADP-heptose:LPS heptosyltransferase